MFKAAPPIQGGREVRERSARPTIEHGARAATENNFQGRYAVRHPWTGPVACEKPVRGVWGGPPGQGYSQPPARAAQDLAFVPRDGVRLASFLRSNVPELGLAASAPDAPRTIDDTTLKVALVVAALLVGLVFLASQKRAAPPVKPS